jgi:anaerobic C4-dicarboxylate transporter
MLQATYLRGVGEAAITIPASATPSETQSVVNALNAQNSRIFKVTIISTVIVGFAAMLNSYRMFKQLQRDEVLFSRKLAKR